MKQINPIFLKDLPNDEHYQFQIDVKKLIDTETPTALRIIPQYQTYAAAFNREKSAIEVEQANPLSKIIKKDDIYRDMLDQGFSLFVESKTMHYDSSVRTAAERIKAILDHYGDLRDYNYSKESSNILSRDQEIKTNCTDELTLIEGVEWLNNIDSASNEFLNHYGERARQEVLKNSRDVHETRMVIDPALDAIVLQINALTVVNGDGEYDLFIDQMNYIVKHYKDLMAARRGHKKEPVISE